MRPILALCLSFSFFIQTLSSSHLAKDVESIVLSYTFPIDFKNITFDSPLFKAEFKYSLENAYGFFNNEKKDIFTKKGHYIFKNLKGKYNKHRNQWFYINTFMASKFLKNVLNNKELKDLGTNLSDLQEKLHKKEDIFHVLPFLEKKGDFQLLKTTLQTHKQCLSQEDETERKAWITFVLRASKKDLKEKIINVKNLFLDGMSDYRRTKIVEAMADVYFDLTKIKDFVDAIQENQDTLFPKNIDVNGRAGIISALAEAHFNATKIKDFVDAIQEINKLFTKDVRGYELSGVIASLSKGYFDPCDIKKFVDAIQENQKNLFSKNMHDLDRAKIISALAEARFEPIEIKNFGQEIQNKEHNVFKKDMDDNSRAEIIATFSKARLNKKQIKEVSALFSDQMNGYGRAKIISALAKARFNPTEIKNFATAIQKNQEKFFPKDMDDNSRAEIISALAEASFDPQKIKAIAGCFNNKIVTRYNKHEKWINDYKKIISYFLEERLHEKQISALAPLFRNFMTASHYKTIIEDLSDTHFSAEEIKSFVSAIEKNKETLFYGYNINEYSYVNIIKDLANSRTIYKQ